MNKQAIKDKSKYIRCIEPDADPLAAWERQKKQERRKNHEQTSDQG
jgi:hypothetical protein